MNFGLRRSGPPTTASPGPNTGGTWPIRPSIGGLGRRCSLRILIVYDCLFPWSIGGAERWYRALAERLAAQGHTVTYVTLRQWPEDNPPRLSGVRVVAAGPRMRLYDNAKRRRWPPLRFGLGVGWYLLRHRHEYDVVHTASFPYWPLLLAAALRGRNGYRLVVDWWEVWTRRYWLHYAGPLAGLAGWFVQRACVRFTPRAFCFSQLHAERLRDEGIVQTPILLRGVYTGPATANVPVIVPDLMVIYAGRHIPEKRVPAIIPALVEARKSLPQLRAVITGAGPDTPTIRRLIDAADLGEVITLPGFVDDDQLDALFRRALCFLLPSRREGYGLVVVEAAARGTPSIVVRDPDNAATELIEDGVNGVVAASASASDLASAILRIYQAGPDLRRSTADWFTRNAERLSLAGSLDKVSAAYRQ